MWVKNTEGSANIHFLSASATTKHQKLSISTVNCDVCIHPLFTRRLRVFIVLACLKLVLGGTVHGVLDTLECDDEVKYRPQLSQDLLLTIQYVQCKVGLMFNGTDN